MTNDPKLDAAMLDKRLQSAVRTAIARKDRVESLSSRLRDIREGNHFRKSLEDLFSGE